MSLPCSSKDHRYLQRALAAVEVGGSAASELSDEAGIPIKFSQALISGYGFFSTCLKRHERLCHGVQALAASVNVVSLSALSINDDSDLAVKLALFSELAYKGALLTSWALSEMKKENGNESNPAQLR